MNRNNKKVIVLAVLLLLLTTGCTKTLKGSDKKVVTNPETGQSLTENILCQPENEKTIKTYEDNGVDLSKYPKLMLITSTFLSTASKIPLAIIEVGANPLSLSTLNIFIFIFCGVLSTMTLHTAVP